MMLQYLLYRKYKKVEQDLVIKNVLANSLKGPDEKIHNLEANM